METKRVLNIAWWIAGFALLGVAGTTAGTITGTVGARGPLPAAAASDGAYSSFQYKFAEKVDYEHLRDFVVYLDQAVPGTEGATTEGAVVTQRNVDFDTHVGFSHHILPIAVGSRVRWPNADEIFHNVYSMSESKAFDLHMYSKDKPAPMVLFDKVGQVDVFCAIHAKMHCIVLVLPNRCFSLTNTRGQYAIENVPAGSYRIKAWHERLPAAVKTVTVPAEGAVGVDFTLGFADLPSP